MDTMNFETELVNFENSEIPSFGTGSLRRTSTRANHEGQHDGHVGRLAAAQKVEAYTSMAAIRATASVKPG